MVKCRTISLPHNLVYSANGIRLPRRQAAAGSAETAARLAQFLKQRQRQRSPPPPARSPRLRFGRTGMRCRSIFRQFMKPSHPHEYQLSSIELPVGAILRAAISALRH